MWKLQPGKGYYVTRNGSAVMAFRMPPEKPTGFMIAAAHSDAPTMKLKDIAVSEEVEYGTLRMIYLRALRKLRTIYEGLDEGGDSCGQKEK